MSGNNYGYYYPTNSQNYAMDPNQQPYWSMEAPPPPPPPPPPPSQQQYGDTYNRPNLQYSNSPLNHSLSRPQNYYHINNGRHFQNRRYPGNLQQNWQQKNNYKRLRNQETSPDNTEPKSKASKKKKKPLSQNIPSKKNWTEAEAERALAVEKEYNKRFKNHSLIIKFPDLELNRDIVTKFHSAIENVHFQQPSTSRFCFVTLQETSDADEVIKSLNQIKFGEGYLTAEYKKDREDDQNLGPGDIDPCTLYVGNLAQEITKEDMVKAYPKRARIDIGYAKKMKYTRYAFVSFKNVDDSIEAFKRTHSTQMYSKSLIVRFRRLHGTVGMPGESKIQSPIKTKADSNNIMAIKSLDESNNRLDENCAELDLSVVKQERDSSDEEEEDEVFRPPFMLGSISVAIAQHKAIVKQEIKTEDEEKDKEREDVEGKSDIAMPSVKTELDNEKENSSEDDDYYNVNFGDLWRHSSSRTNVKKFH